MICPECGNKVVFCNVWIDEKDSETIGMELVCTNKECKYNPINFMDSLLPLQRRYLLPDKC